MNLDYIEITKFMSKDRLCFHDLQWLASYEGAERYCFKRCNKIEVWIREISGQVVIKGSIPYFINGHNYFSSSNDWLEGLEYIQGCLKTNLFSGLVTSFEFGTIIEVPFPEDDFLRNHIKISGMKTKPYQDGNILTGKEFESTLLKTKLYNVSRNIKNKLNKAIQEEISSVHGWDRHKHYIKLENHYKKPEAYFRHEVYVNELLSLTFQLDLQQRLFTSYTNIMKTGNIIIPSHKADINAGTIPLLILKELEAKYHFSTEDLIKQKLNSIPGSVFSPADRKARLRIMRENLKKIHIKEKSQYDISEILKSKLSKVEISSEEVEEIQILS
jgi:hypothetical protein